MGRGGSGPRPRGGPADPAVGRLLRLPLVPRDGARVLREPRDRRLHERALRQRQGRPRGASRRRRDLHGGGASNQRPRRLADDRLPRPRRRPLLRRHLLPTGREPRHAELPDGDGSGRACLRDPARGDPRKGTRHPPQPGRDRRGRATGGAARPGRPRASGAAAAGGGRSPQRRLRERPEVPARLLDRAAPGPRRDRGGRADPRRDARRRHLRPARGRLLPLLGRRDLACPPLREDALRQHSARPRLPARVARAGARALPARLRGDPGLDAARDARPRGRLLLGPRRRLRGRGGPFLRLDAGADPRRPRRRGRAGDRALRRHRGGQLRGLERPPPGGRRRRPGAGRA